MADESIQWDAWQTDVETTDLNSLADGSNVLSAEVTNSSERAFIQVAVTLATVNLSAQTNPAVYVWLLGTNDAGYEDGGASENPARPPDIIIPVREANDSFILIKTGFVPDVFKPLIGNRCGATWAASGNTFDYRLGYRQIV